jgi:TldD protein
VKLDCLDRLDLSKFNCDYCDVRVEDVRRTDIGYRNGELLSCDSKPSLGAFLRVYARGRWFYASSTALDSLEEQIKALCATAEGFPGGAAKDLFSAIKPYERGLLNYRGREHSALPLSKKRELCEAYLPILQSDPLLRESSIYYSDYYKVKHFKSSKGVRYAYDKNLAGIYFYYTLKDGEQLFDDYIRASSASFEDLRGLEGKIRDGMAESKLFLAAKTVTPGNYRVLMASSVVGVFAHESFGHKSEADAMLGDENAKKEWAIGSKIASDCVTIVDEGTLLGSSGYCPFDDEGTPAQKTVLIDKGVLSGRLHSLSTAQALGEKPTGNARSIDFEYEPIVRMTSTYVEAGKDSFEELLAKCGEGIYIKDWKHGSGLSRFTIAPKKSYWVRQGKLAEPVLVAVITGSVFETLGRIEACGSDFEMHSSVLGGCGKNDQGPLPVADGGPTMLVSEMQVS